MIVSWIMVSADHGINQKYTLGGGGDFLYFLSQCSLDWSESQVYCVERWWVLGLGWSNVDCWDDIFWIMAKVEVYYVGKMASWIMLQIKWLTQIRNMLQ